MSELPLQGIRVVDLTWVIAGPVATRILGDFGAEILKIEHEQALDPIRMGRPIVGDEPNFNNSGFFNYINRDKLSVQLNVRHPMGIDVLKKLIDQYDSPVLVADSSKFGHAGFVTITPMESVETLITDGDLSPEAREELAAVGVEVQLV